MRLTDLEGGMERMSPVCSDDFSLTQRVQLILSLKNKIEKEKAENYSCLNITNAFF